MREPVLRPASTDDAERIARLHIDSWRKTYVREMPAAFLEGLDVPARTAKWRERLEQGVRVVVAEDGPEMIGYISCGPAEDPPPEGKTWEIYNLHVVWSRQRQGIGRRLFDAAAEIGRKEGAGALVLWVVETNSKARSFYEGKGMAVDGRRRERFEAGGFSLHEVRYRMKIGPARGAPPQPHRGG